MAVSPLRAFAEQSAARARNSANQVRSIADSTQAALDQISMRSGMISGAMTPDMAGNIPYQSQLVASGIEDRAGQVQTMAAEMPQLINAYRAYKAEQDAKAKAGNGAGGGTIVNPTTPELPTYGQYLNYANVPSESRIAQEFNTPYQYTAPNVSQLPVTKKPMSTISAAYKRMLESRANK